MADDMREALDSAFAEDALNRFKDTEAFRYHSFTGRPLEGQQASAAIRNGWTDADIEAFNAALKLHLARNPRASFGTDLSEALKEAGMGTARPDEEMIVIQPKE